MVTALLEIQPNGQAQRCAHFSRVSWGFLNLLRQAFWASVRTEMHGVTCTENANRADWWGYFQLSAPTTAFPAANSKILLRREQRGAGLHLTPGREGSSSFTACPTLTEADCHFIPSSRTAGTDVLVAPVKELESPSPPPPQGLPLQVVKAKSLQDVVKRMEEEESRRSWQKVPSSPEVGSVHATETDETFCANTSMFYKEKNWKNSSMIFTLRCLLVRYTVGYTYTTGKEPWNKWLFIGINK